MNQPAKLVIEGKDYTLPVIIGTEAEHALDITKLRAETGHITMDTGYANTGSCLSAITYLDGEKGILRYRGIPIEQLATKSTFVETAYLLIYGNLPSKKQLAEFSAGLTRHSLIHEDMKHFFTGYPSTAHPMAILSSMVCSMSAYYPDCLDVDDQQTMQNNIIRILSKLRTIAAFSYKKSIGQAMIYPRNDLSYCANFLNMMFAVSSEPYQIDPDMVQALNLLLILHADHEQNCSTSTVRMVGSAKANLFAAVSAGICALWGPLHGGANQAVMDMLQAIHTGGGNVQKAIDSAKDKSSKFRLMGFGHRVYKNFDPRSNVLKTACDKILGKLGVHDPLLDIAKGLEEAALKDSYFIDKQLYPNVDFYSGILYRALGFPTNMFTVMFAIGRLPGWIANYMEMLSDPATRIGRPRQVYTGPTARDYVPMEKR